MTSLSSLLWDLACSYSSSEALQRDEASSQSFWFLSLLAWAEATIPVWLTSHLLRATISWVRLPSCSLSCSRADSMLALADSKASMKVSSAPTLSVHSDSILSCKFCKTFLSFSRVSWSAPPWAVARDAKAPKVASKCSVYPVWTAPLSITLAWETRAANSTSPVKTSSKISTAVATLWELNS